MTQLFARTRFGRTIDLEDDIRAAVGNREKAAVDDTPVGQDHRGGPFGAIVWSRANDRRSWPALAASGRANHDWREGWKFLR